MASVSTKDPTKTLSRETQFYGRRKGRPVRTQKRHLLETVLPTITMSLKENAPDGSLDPRSFFSKLSSEVWLEIGFGGGEHLAEMAFQNSEVSFLGSEVFLNGVASFLEHHEQKNLSNVRLFPDDVRLLLNKLKSESLNKIFILFPDPWPKARHNKRRLVQEDTLKKLSSLLVKGGELRLASDHEDYIAWIEEEIKKVPALRLIQKQTFISQDEKPSCWPVTRYEQKALEQGIACTYFSLEK